MTLRIKGATTIKGLASVGWSPNLLFAAGEQGVWYDPSDFSTMFQDTAGTTPVTATGQSVALLLDKRFPGFSGYFDGTGDYLSTPNNSAFNFGSGSFTVEAWIYATAFSAGINCIVSNYGGTTTGWAVQINSNKINANLSGDGFDITGTTSLSTNTWYHVALSGASGSIKLFINGSQEGPTYTGAVSLDTSSILTIGGLWGGALYNPFSGHISNVRIIKGAALYTSNFTPPTSPLTPVSGTSLLTCQSALFVDNSGNSFPLTVNGDTRVINNNPFGNNATQSTAASRPTLQIDGNGKYYLSFDGSNDFLEVSSANDVVSASSPALAWVGAKGNVSALGTYYSIGTTTKLHVSQYVSNVVYTNGVDASVNATQSAAIATSSNHVVFFNITVGQKLAMRFNASDVSSTISQSSNIVARTGSNGMFIGGRETGVGQFFNGRIYGVIVRGAATSAQQITNAETYMNTRTGAY